jgi:hypothetical protein
MHGPAVRHNQVADVNFVAQTDLVRQFDLDALLDVWHQALSPVLDQRNPVSGHVSDKNLDKALLVDQQVDHVLGRRVGCLKIDGLELCVIFNELLKLLGLNLKLRFAKSV